MTIEKLNEQIANAEIVIKSKQKLIRNAKSKILAIEKDEKFKAMEIELEKFRNIDNAKNINNTKGIFG